MEYLVEDIGNSYHEFLPRMGIPILFLPWILISSLSGLGITIIIIPILGHWMLGRIIPILNHWMLGRIISIFSIIFYLSIYMLGRIYHPDKHMFSEGLKLPTRHVCMCHLEWVHHGYMDLSEVWWLFFSDYEWMMFLFLFLFFFFFRDGDIDGL